jgi:hypothetical protein
MGRFIFSRLDSLGHDPLVVAPPGCGPPGGGPPGRGPLGCGPLGCGPLGCGPLGCGKADIENTVYRQAESSHGELLLPRCSSLVTIDLSSTDDTGDVHADHCRSKVCWGCRI